MARYVNPALTVTGSLPPCVDGVLAVWTSLMLISHPTQVGTLLEMALNPLLFITRCGLWLQCPSLLESVWSVPSYVWWSPWPTASTSEEGGAVGVTGRGVTMFICTLRAFKRSTFRLNGLICIGIFLGFLGGFVETLAVHFFLENCTVMTVIVNVSPVISNISAACVVIHKFQTTSPPSGDKLVISPEFCPGIWCPPHEDVADIPHLL